MPLPLPDEYWTVMIVEWLSIWVCLMFSNDQIEVMFNIP